MDNGARASKSTQSAGQIPAATQEAHKAPVPLDNPKTISLYAPTSEPFANRLLGCLVISPAGKVLSGFDSVPQLLTALRDAIQAHRSLYIQGKILHRDISENNIIITDPKKADGFTGILIDLELAKNVGSGLNGARY